MQAIQSAQSISQSWQSDEQVMADHGSTNVDLLVNKDLQPGGTSEEDHGKETPWHRGRPEKCLPFPARPRKSSQNQIPYLASNLCVQTNKQAIRKSNSAIQNKFKKCHECDFHNN
jgi:hypothetical protein